jgi:hypothetical protein
VLAPLARTSLSVGATARSRGRAGRAMFRSTRRCQAVTIAFGQTMLAPSRCHRPTTSPPLRSDCHFGCTLPPDGGAASSARRSPAKTLPAVQALAPTVPEGGYRPGTSASPDGHRRPGRAGPLSEFARSSVEAAPLSVPGACRTYIRARVKANPTGSYELPTFLLGQRGLLQSA